ncbi:MAG: EAL domain-containing protein [Gammaproteobacteria bacterium]|nr:EAL domain-containing protein [Gammaproteobacteria bacterium]
MIRYDGLQRLTAYWQRWTKPVVPIPDPVSGHPLRLLLQVLLILILLGGGLALLLAVAAPRFNLELIAVLVAESTLGLAYWVGRRGYQGFAALLLCMLPTLGSVNAYLAGDVTALIFLIIGIMLGGAFLSFQTTALLALINITLAAGLSANFPRPQLHLSTTTLLVFVVSFSVLRLVLMRHRDYIVALQQDRLAKSEESLRALAENATEGILVNAAGKHVFANHYLELLLGYERNALIGTDLHDVVHSSEVQKLEKLFVRCGDTEILPVQYDTVFKNKQAASVAVEINAARTLWQGEPAVMILVRDIRNRLQRDHALRESELRLRSITENSSDFILLTDRNGRIQFINRVLHGMAYADVIGKTIFDFNAADANQIIRAAVDKVLQTGEPTRYETSIQHPGTGETVWFETNISPIKHHVQVTGLVLTARDVTSRISAEQSILETAHELGSILSNMQDTYYRSDLDGCLIRISNSVERLLGYSPKELYGKKIAELYYEPNEREHFLRTLDQSGGEMMNFETRLRHKDGSMVWVSTNSRHYTNTHGEVAGVEGTVRNVTERKLTEEKMRTLSSALEQTADLVMIADRQGMITYVNSAFERVTGYASHNAVGKPTNLLRSGKHGAEFYKRLWETILAGEAFSDVLVNRRFDGVLYYEEKTITPIRDAQGAITHFVSTGKDITERMHTQERLRFMAHHDALTELPNRVLFLDRLKQAIARARWHERKVAVMFMDLDRFKNINDTLGHNIGDQLLIRLTQRLAGSVRTGDTVARFGGDEFAILLDDVATEQDVTLVAKKILSKLAPVFEIEQRELFITASIGISIFPADGDDSEALLRNADVAMYRAKDMGRNNYQFYSSEMSARAFERLTLENALRYALHRQEFFLLYQPQVDARSGQLIGVEALLRWQHPELGIVMPSDFVTLLEETGLIVPVGEWVIKQACQQARLWQQQGIKLKMSVNLSGRQFNDPDFLGAVQTILSEAQVSPGALEFELTESLLMRNASNTLQALDTLNTLGVQLAIDDFGTGYSSLSYLRRFPITTLKVDRSFVRDVIKDPDDAAIATAIIVMAQSLNLNVVAEGVETEEQLSFLQSLDCYHIQGYYFSQAVSVEQIATLYTQGVRYSNIQAADNKVAWLAD